MTIATGEQALAADVNAIASSKLITGSRANDTSGDVAYTGVGFQPRTIIALAFPTGTGAAESSIGIADENLAEYDSYIRERNGGDRAIYTGGEAFLISIYPTLNSLTDFQRAVLKTLDADGFTLTWTKGGSGATCNLAFLCIR